MKKYILALDQGTTSSRAMLIDHNGRIVAVKQREFQQYFPNPGWVEHDAQDIWSSQASVIAELLAHHSINGQDIHAIGITNQRETVVVWDRKTSKPICKAIVWQDRRTTPFCQELKEKGLEDKIRKKTGLLIDPYFSASKLRWILENVPKAREKAKKGDLCFGTIDSWLIWKLSNGKKHLTDATNASRTMLYNINEDKWDKELLDLFEIPESMLPTVCDSSGEIAHALLPSLSEPIPICGVAGDQQAALFGQRCIKPGMGKVTYGTGAFILMHIGDKAILSDNKMLTTIATRIDGKLSYAMEGSLFVAGAIVQWLRDGLKIIKESKDIEALARSVKSTEGVFFVPALTGLGAPYWNPHTRGTLLGITRGTTNAHIARAALEGIAFQATVVLQAMIKDTSINISELRVDGGAAEDDLLMQFQTDLLGAPLLRPQNSESTTIGAAFLAGLGSGFWKNQTELANFWQLDKKYEPKIGRKEAEQRLVKWRKAVACAMTWSADE